MKNQETPMDGKRRRPLGRIAKWLGLVLIVLIALELSGGLAIWDVSAVCPKCLQHAYIRERTLFGVPFYRRTVLSQRHGGIMSSAAFSPGIPQVHPGLYKEIIGKECKHNFLRGGFGRTSGFFIGGHADGSYGGWSLAQPRINALKALYGAFAKTSDRETATALYLLIEDAYPLNGRNRAVWAAIRPFRAEDATEDDIMKAIQAIEEYDTEAGMIARKILELKRLTARLKEVETTADFQVVGREITGSPKGEREDDEDR